MNTMLFQLHENDTPEFPASASVLLGALMVAFAWLWLAVMP